MKKKQKDVKSLNQIVGNIEIPIFESLSEATEHLGEDKCLLLLNRKYEEDLTTDARRTATNTSNRTLLSRLKSKGIDTSPEGLKALVEKLNTIERQKNGKDNIFN